jgi:hypothetical protein
VDESPERLVVYKKWKWGNHWGINDKPKLIEGAPNKAEVWEGCTHVRIVSHPSEASEVSSNPTEEELDTFMAQRAEARRLVMGGPQSFRGLRQERDDLKAKLTAAEALVSRSYYAMMPARNLLVLKEIADSIAVDERAVLSDLRDALEAIELSRMKYLREHGEAEDSSDAQAAEIARLRQDLADRVEQNAKFAARETGWQRANAALIDHLDVCEQANARLRVQIAERDADGWLCGVCGKMLEKMNEQQASSPPVKETVFVLMVCANPVCVKPLTPEIPKWVAGPNRYCCSEPCRDAVRAERENRT